MKYTIEQKTKVEVEIEFPCYMAADGCYAFLKNEKACLIVYDSSIYAFSTESFLSVQPNAKPCTRIEFEKALSIANACFESTLADEEMHVVIHDKIAI